MDWYDDPIPGDVTAPTDLGYSDTTEEVQDWQNVDNGGTMEGWKYQDGVWTDPAGKSYDLSYLNVKDKGVLSQLLGYAKKMLGGKGTTEEYMQLLPLLGGLLGANQSSNPSILNPGYQGGIPQVTATRNMLTEPPAGRRPGSGGINYGGDVTYTRTGQNLSAENAGISTPGSQALGGTAPVADIASLLALIQQLQSGGAGAGGTTTPTFGTPNTGHTQIRHPEAGPTLVAGPGDTGMRDPNMPDPTRKDDPWYLANRDKYQYVTNTIASSYSPTGGMWVKTSEEDPNAAKPQTPWDALSDQQRMEMLRPYMGRSSGARPVGYAEVDPVFERQLIEDFNRRNPYNFALRPEDKAQRYVANDPSTYGSALAVKDIQNWWQQNQGKASQADLDKFLTLGYSPELIAQAVPQFNVADLRNAISGAQQRLQTPTPAPAPAPAPAAPSYLGDIQNWYQQNQGGPQENLDKFLATSGFTAQQISEALPQFGVSDLEKAIAGAQQRVMPMKAEGGLLPDGFVIPADVVSHLGNGSSEAGLELLAEELGAKPIKGEGDGMSDSIPTTIGGNQPARVANEEAFVPPEVVKRLGNGDTERGAKKLYAMMDRIRKARTGTTAQGKEINPEKFMPGGKVNRYAVGGTTTGATAGGGLASQSLADWVGPYVADMLGKGQALAESPYQAYTGPLTAGASPLQQQAFQAAGNLQAPTQFGQATGIAGAAGQRALDVGYTPVGQSITGGPLTQPISGAPTSAVPSMTGTQPVSNIAQAYMNPYLESVLSPQLREARKEADISRAADAARMAKAGAFGGSRQAIMESEGTRNLLNRMSDITGAGYANAYDKAIAQFNAEQARKIAEAQFGATYGMEGVRTGLQGAQTLGQLGSQQQQSTIDNLRALAEMGATQRGIEAEGIAADKAQFEEARLNPYKMLQFQQSLLSGLPLASQSLTTPGMSNLDQFGAGFSSVAKLLQYFYPNLFKDQATTTKP